MFYQVLSYTANKACRMRGTRTQIAIINTPITLRLPAALGLSSRNMSTNNAGLSEEKTSVDSKQEKFFSKSAHDWWDPNGRIRVLHSMNSLRIPLIRDGLIATKQVHPAFANTTTPLKGLKILDVGCGGGILSEPIARLGADVTGIDASYELIQVAKVHAQMDKKLQDNLAYIQISSEKHVLDHRGYYDSVVASEVVEHVNDQDFFVKKCVELTKPGGSIFVTTMTKTNMAWLGGIIAAEYMFGLIPKGTHDWDLFITPEALQKIFEKYGCQTKLIRGMTYIPVLSKWVWSPNVRIFYAMQVVKTPV